MKGQNLIINRKQFMKIAGVGDAVLIKALARGAVTETPSKKIKLDENTFKYLQRRRSRLESDLNREGDKRKHAILKKKVELLVQGIDIYYVKPLEQSEKYEAEQRELDKLIDPQLEMNVDEMRKKHDLSTIKIIADIRQKNVDTQKKVLDQKIQRGEYVERAKLSQIIFHYLESLNDNILNMPTRHINQIIAIIEAEGRKAKGRVEQILVDEISQKIRDTKEEIKKILSDKIDKDGEE